MSNFEIHELTEKAINRNSNIIHDTLYGEDYETGKNLAGAVADLASANVASPYDDTVTYAIGQYCLYEGDIYRCIAITTGAFDSTKWTQIVVTGEFRRVVELTSAQYTALSSAEKNNGTLYILTDEEPTAADISYTRGVSVADKLDTVPSYIPDTQTITASNGATVKLVRIGNVAYLIIPDMGFQYQFPTSWADVANDIIDDNKRFRGFNISCTTLTGVVITFNVNHTTGRLRWVASSSNSTYVGNSIAYAPYDLR